MSLLPRRKRNQSLEPMQKEAIESPIAPIVNDRVIRMPEVMQITGLKCSTIYKHSSLGTFPPVVKITGRASGWKTSEINRWLSGERNFKQERGL